MRRFSIQQVTPNVWRIQFFIIGIPVQKISLSGVTITSVFQCMCTYGLCKRVGKTGGKCLVQAIRSTLLPNLDAVKSHLGPFEAVLGRRWHHKSVLFGTRRWKLILTNLTTLQLSTYDRAKLLSWRYNKEYWLLISEFYTIFRGCLAPHHKQPSVWKTLWYHHIKWNFGHCPLFKVLQNTALRKLLFFTFSDNSR